MGLTVVDAKGIEKAEPARQPIVVSRVSNSFNHTIAVSRVADSFNS